MFTAPTLADTPQAKRRQEEPTPVDLYAPMRAAADYARAEMASDELPELHEENAPRALL